MPRPAPTWLGPRTRLGATIAALVIAAFLPPTALSLTGWLSTPVQRVIAPAQRGLTTVVAWARGRATQEKATSPQVAELEKQRDQLRFALLQAQQQVRELRQVISDLSHSVELNPGQRLRLVTAPVIGGPADLTSKVLTVRAGAAQGVEPNSVAVIHGVHLVGKVAAADHRACKVLPITDPSHRPFNAVIMLDPDRRGPGCQLEPDRRGRLKGRVVEDPSLRDAASQAPLIQPGMTVRLDDRDWPASAQMLVVGKVISVEPLPNQPLRQYVVVEPYHAIERATEVTIRTLMVDDGTGTPAAPSGAPAKQGGTGSPGDS